MSARCAATETWFEIPPHGVRLRCALPAGHGGEHGCADIEYLPETVERATGRVGGYAHELEDSEAAS